MNIEPRPWQTDFTRTALAYFDQQRSRNFLAAVCPGAGKTVGAYLLIKDLLGRGDIRHAIIVGHTDRIRSQWIETARQVELRAMTDIPTSNRNWPRDIPVLVMTYQQVVNRAEAVARLATEDVPTLVVFDEIHHAGDEYTWGTRLKTAFRSARKRLLLTGTPFRNDGQAIPYVRYDPRTQRVQPDFSMSYADALKHGYVAPLYFYTYDAEGRWAKGDDEFEGSFTSRLNQEQAGYLLNTAITRPAFIRRIVGDAHERLLALRQNGHVDAGGLIITRDQSHARDVAEQVREITGTSPVIVISDDADANVKLEQARNSMDEWIVAVRMVTEGVDIRRLRIGVYLTNVKSDLFFWQFTGRINRTVPGLDDQSGHIFIPADQDLLEYAKEVYQQRLHVLPPKHRYEKGTRAQSIEGEPVPAFKAIAATPIAGAVIDPGSGTVYPLSLMQWAAREKAEQGLWSISEVDYIKMACRFWNVSVEELIARIKGANEEDRRGAGGPTASGELGEPHAVESKYITTI